LIKTLIPICAAASEGQPVSLILLDIDHLKILNDRLGIRQGDKILTDLGQLIRRLCQTPLVARTRGGEFGILVEAAESVANQIANVIQRAVNRFPWSDHKEITVSFGVAGIIQSCEPSLLLSRADEALFAAKANGRNRVVCHSEIARISNRHNDELDVISMENKARVLSERVTSFVTQRSKRIMQSLRKEANTDGLTQLFNRRYLDQRLVEEFQHAIATDKDLCIALLDLDHFGNVNKRHGWPTGDKVLRLVADTILQNIRVSDWVGRYGGEEICVVMPGTSLESAAVVCERIRSTIEAMPFESTTGQSLHVTLSIGVVALDPASDTDVAALIERVSDLTLRAKEGGRNQVQSSNLPPGRSGTARKH
jgi:diguanylate cyclase (GGDEF)-like protein